ncbi:DnaJ domain-containing protein [Halosegnis longus]|uniref:DnaJ domain-containing protein n=1 Tax=Halosegnis longus TaxID=2216012 RepID=UPI0026CCE4F0
MLGVDIDADEEAVTAAYRDRVKETHPDRDGDEAEFKRVRWAYEYLHEHRDD